jgi:hypothetical protein
LTFGVSGHLDDAGIGLARQHEDRLLLAEARDRADFHELVVGFRRRVNLSASGPGPGFYAAPLKRVRVRFLKPVWVDDSHAIGRAPFRSFSDIIPGIRAPAHPPNSLESGRNLYMRYQRVVGDLTLEIWVGNE